MAIIKSAYDLISHMLASAGVDLDRMTVVNRWPAFSRYVGWNPNRGMTRWPKNRRFGARSQARDYSKMHFEPVKITPRRPNDFTGKYWERLR